MYDTAMRQALSNRALIITMSVPSPFAQVNALAVFDKFLKNRQLQRVDDDPDRAVRESFQEIHQQKQQDEILLVADFLFARSCLDGALQVLEQGSTVGSSHTTTVISLNGKSSNTCHGVTRLQSPQRFLFVVKGQSTSGKQGYRGHSESSSYLCFVPEQHGAIGPFNHSDGEYTADEGAMGIYYCSCRSFLERSRASPPSAVASALTTTTSTESLCKHLLALKLMPALGMVPCTLEFASDEELGQEVAQRLCPNSL
jgi:hypothetical protein